MYSSIADGICVGLFLGIALALALVLFVKRHVLGTGQVEYVDVEENPYPHIIQPDFDNVE